MGRRDFYNDITVAVGLPNCKTTPIQPKEQGWGSRSILALRSFYVLTPAGEIQWSWSQNAFGQPGPGLFDTSPHLHDLYHHTALTSSRSSPLCRQRDLFVSPLSTPPSPHHHFWTSKCQWHGMTGEHDPLNAHACMTMQLITAMLHMMMLILTMKVMLMMLNNIFYVLFTTAIQSLGGFLFW